MTLGALAKRGLEYGVQCMIEGPGHVPMNEVEAQIISIKKMTHGAPLYVLGPLTIDSSPGYDHIAGAIGGAMAVRVGVDFLCYLTPAEHLTLPDIDDVRQGIMLPAWPRRPGKWPLAAPMRSPAKPRWRRPAWPLTGPPCAKPPSTPLSSTSAANPTNMRKRAPCAATSAQ